MYEIEKTHIEDVLIFNLKKFQDERGYFFVLWNKFNLSQYLPGYDFIQDNISKSKINVIRGLHYQLKNPQGKLVSVIRGKVLDVVVDLRKSSKTFGKSISVELSEDNGRILWIPEGFAHGFKVLTDEAYFLYKVTAPYDPTDEYCLKWDDDELAIDWDVKDTSTIIVSEKDSKGIALKDAKVFK